ncbi:MAG: hypothetical protein IPK53_07440 [bacterium]|nr:hypothetical protein [bacterium]
MATEDDLAAIARFAEFLQHMFALRTLPIDDLALSRGDELFARGDVHEVDLAIAYQIATVLRRWRDANPDWRLPDLAAQLEDVVQAGAGCPSPLRPIWAMNRARPYTPHHPAQRQRAGVGRGFPGGR